MGSNPPLLQNQLALISFERFLPISKKLTSIVLIWTEKGSAKGAVAQLFWQCWKKSWNSREAKMKERGVSLVTIYSYFEKGCRKKCTRQSRKVLWVVLSALLFKEIWKNGTGGHGHMFASAKGKQQKYVRQLQSSGTVFWSYPILPFGIVECTFFPTTFLEITVYIWINLGTVRVKLFPKKKTT